jgi:hypothetical protein
VCGCLVEDVTADWRGEEQATAKAGVYGLKGSGGIGGWGLSGFFAALRMTEFYRMLGLNGFMDT